MLEAAHPFPSPLAFPPLTRTIFMGAGEGGDDVRGKILTRRNVFIIINIIISSST
jgi:hypothetical protein